MNTQNRQDGNDGTLDEGLDELGRKYRELGADTPPDLLDQAILNSAHRAVEKKSGWTQFGWLHGLTTAAIIVLAFTIVLQQREPIPPEEGIILESRPPEIRSQSMPSARKQEVTPAASKDLEEAADSNLVIQAYSEPRKEGQPLENMADASSETREREVSLEEEQATGTRAKTLDASEADFAAASMRPESDDEDVLQDTRAAEQQLAEILRLKNAGDETWHEALESFRQQFPEYPLPAELED
ncbi:MAG: hypothetical protein OQJ84_02660 [Xanthomonadales bacterium]|nr:hypothetical protein [Xanthomonadales bacterium]